MWTQEKKKKTIAENAALSSKEGRNADSARCERMKSISVKRIVAVAAGAAMIGAAFAGAVTPEGLGSYPFFSNGEPQVKIVVGANSKASDGVVAANIAAMIGNLAYTSRAIEVQGQDSLVCVGGSGTAGTATCTLGDKSTTLEITTPGVNPAIAYSMKSYIEDYLDWNAMNDDNQARNTTYGSVPFSPNETASGKTGSVDYYGQRVTASETPLLYAGYLNDNVANKKYKEEERVYIAAQSVWYDADRKIEITPPNLAYHIQFVDPVPFCTNILAGGNCSSSDLTENHHVKIRFLGEDWTIMGFSGYNALAATASTVLTLGKEITTNGLMQVGDVVTDSSSNYTVKLISVSPFSTTTAQVRDAQFQALDGSGNVVGTYRIVEGSTDTVVGPNIVIKVNKLFSGTGGVANADVTLYSQKLEVKGTGNLDSDNTNWQTSIELYNTTVGGLANDAIKGIRLTRLVSTNYLKNAGDYLSIVDKPQAFKLAYTGLSTIEYEPLTFSIFRNTIPLPQNSTDSSTNASYGIQISATKTGAFSIGGENVNTVYLKPQFNTSINASANFTLYYLKSNGYYGNSSLNQLNTSGSTLSFYYGGGAPALINITASSAAVYLAGAGGSGANGTITISEPVTASDTGKKGLHTIYFYELESASNFKLLQSEATAYARYNYEKGDGNATSVAQNSIGYITPRGSVFKSLSSTQAGIDFAKTVQYATFTLSRGSSASATGNVAEVTQTEGDTYDIGGGYFVKVKSISATASASGGAGEVTGAVVSPESLMYLQPNPSSADSIVALHTANNPLVVLDTDAAAASTSKLIVIGGPMVNAVAASLPGADAVNTPGAAVVKAVGDKILVAGYSAMDTKAASDALISYLASKRQELTSG